MTHSPAPTSTGVQPVFRDKADEGYRKNLKARHMRMIAIGGAIGTGLFLGTSGRIAQGGPSVALVYAVCGFIAYLMLRALGELTIYRPSSGSFISYAREFIGEKGAFYTGWFAFITYSSALMADISAIASYLHYWPILQVIPKWGWALLALAIVVVLNLASVKFFGEFEFWFAMIKVVAILAFMVIAVVVLVASIPVAGHAPGLSAISENGGIFPRGAFQMVVLSIGILFAFGGTEFIGFAAGEATDPKREMPRAVNSMMWRILLFYIGCVVLFSLLLPYNAYDKNESPFVTFFAGIGIPAAATIMNLVVLIAAASAINAELYTAGRVLRSMAVTGSAPRSLSGMNRNAVPYAGICASALIGLVGVMVNMFYPSYAFEILALMAGLGICTYWGSIMVSHLRFQSYCRTHQVERPKYRLFWAPFTNYLVLVVLVAMVVLMWWEGGPGPAAILSYLGLTAVLSGIWFLIRKRVDHQ